MGNNNILDACALIAYMEGEEGADIIEKLLLDSLSGRITLFIHSINLLEVYYHIRIKQSEAVANYFLENIENSIINVISETSSELIKEAGRIKSTHKLSLADSIGLATSIVYNGHFVTADYHELETIAKTEKLNILWFREKKKK